MRPDLDRRTIIGIAFGDSEEDLFLPARLILDNRDYISTDHRELKLHCRSYRHNPGIMASSRG
jgi:hypothetical protein